MKKISTKRIKVTGDCNQDCVFCDSNASRDPGLYSKKRIKAQISKRSGLRRLNITGGEPTICKPLGEYIRLAKKSGYKDIVVLTNGVRFSHKKYALQIQKSGLTEAVVSIYHYDPKISDQISKVKGSFRKKIGGIANLRNMGIEVTVNIVIFSGNFAAIAQLVEYLHSFFDIKNFAFSFLEPNCERVAKNPELIPSLKKSLVHLKKAIGICKKKWLRYFIPYNGAIPPCVFNASGLETIKPERIIGTDFDSSRSYYPVCSKCSEKKYCLGILKEYAPECLEILKKKAKR